MANDPDVRQQDRAIRNVAVWGGVFGVILVAMLIIWALQPGHVGTLRTNNPADQPGTAATSSTNPSGNSGGNNPASGNTGTSGNATTLGSGPPGSGTGSPTGSSGNVSGSNPPNGTTRSDTTGSGTR
ncbi:MAG: hypothetical protein ACJ8FV_18835 [Xanthobacteraceae bacterium]